MGFLSFFFQGDLNAAIKKGDIGTLKRLLDAGGAVNGNGSRMTPLMAAARTGQVDAMTLLLDSGAEVEARDSMGTTALMHAAGGWGCDEKSREERCLEAVKLLLERGADPNACGRRGQTSMRYALGAGNRRVMELLRVHGGTDCPEESSCRSGPIGAQPAVGR